jgi:predicted Rossmann fold flavoprotein
MTSTLQRISPRLEGQTAYVDIAVIGAGAAGLFAGVWAGRNAGHNISILALDGARVLGAKILVAGGGRCNVTHDYVDEKQYAGTSRNAIRNVLRNYDVSRTIEFFAQEGVTLKREETGKLFPTTDEARTVLDALVHSAARAGVLLVHPWRAASVVTGPEGDFIIERAEGAALAHDAKFHGITRIVARRLVLATGGMALPRSGSDGAGYEFARGLGHSITPMVFPALVPLVLEKGHWLTSLSGLTLDARLTVLTGARKKLTEQRNSTLLTHFGLSGPSVLDVSRYFTAAKAQDAGTTLELSLLPDISESELDAAFIAGGAKAVYRVLTDLNCAERLARAACETCGVVPGSSCHALRKDTRRALVVMMLAQPLAVVGDRGFTFAEVTAGGVPLNEVFLDRMLSRMCPGLYLCGEILDVDGRVGGYNFQWAWASGYAAGVGAARDLSSTP